MRSVPRERLGLLLIILGIVSAVGPLAGSAAFASDITSGPSGANSAEIGRTLVGVQSTGEVALLGSHGDPLWKMARAKTHYFDVTMLNNGSVLTAILVKNQQSCSQYEPPCARTGIQIIDPRPQPHTVYEWTFPVRTQLNSEVHDAEQLPTGEFLLTDMEHERIFTLDPNGTITWQWNASTYYDTPPDPTQTDWLHINDVDRIGPETYLVSVRNANQILIIERGRGVVEVINKDETSSNDNNCSRSGQLVDSDGDGDIRCGDPDVINHQHNPQYLGPGALLIADSENDRVVELQKGERKWRVTWVVDSAGGIAFDWPRDADRLPNGHTLITDTRNNRLVEITENGKLVWSTEIGIWPYDADRLPFGERPTGQVHDAQAHGNDPQLQQPELPVFERAQAALSYVVPLPYWFTPWHLGMITVGISLLCLGAVLIRSASSGTIAYD